jgi:hypothetical protein
MAIAKKRKRSFEKLALVAGTSQTLSNLFLSFDIYGGGLSHRHLSNID